jgi:hypothetical protein
MMMHDPQYDCTQEFTRVHHCVQDTMQQSPQADGESAWKPARTKPSARMAVNPRTATPETVTNAANPGSLAARQGGGPEEFDERSQLGRPKFCFLISQKPILPMLGWMDPSA